MEADREVTLTATVQDTETPADRLSYEWTADRGTFTGAGPEVRWRAPRDGDTPGSYDLELTVIERYTVTDWDGSVAFKENRASGKLKMFFNDSPREISNLVLQFLGEFSNSNISPETCIRHFTDTCRGKQEELEDIRDNRARFVILNSRFRVQTVRINDRVDQADIIAPCEFTSRVKATGRTESITGDCLLTSVYQQHRWWLCDSLFKGS